MPTAHNMCIFDVRLLVVLSNNYYIIRHSARRSIVWISYCWSRIWYFNFYVLGDEISSETLLNVDLCIRIKYFPLQLRFFLFRRVRKISKKRLLASSCLSVRPHGTTRLPIYGFSWNLIFEDFFLKMYWENSSFIKIISFLVGPRTYQHLCTLRKITKEHGSQVFR